MALLALALLLAIQLVQPPDPVATLPGTGTMVDHVEVPPTVLSILRRACFDCHSAETVWPVYARVSPISWLVARDVQNGRSDLDFSSWSTDPQTEPTPRQRLVGICYDIEENIMPPRAYLLAHPSARLSEKEKLEVCSWVRSWVEENAPG